jgi:superfamily II DNA or RNA helicase/Arc/MetJ-type ribon-helix-helix transcriptional regulator
VTRGLRELSLRTSYRSDRGTIAREFYIPCLERSTRLDRAAGYFTSSSLSVLADGLEPFIARSGSIRIVVSPHLNEEDVDAIKDGYEARAEVVRRALRRELARPMPDAHRERLGLLAWLVGRGRLDFKVALVERQGSLGIYHEKFGVFVDAAGDYVAFSGSANESAGGLVSNFESLDVYRSWDLGDAQRAEEKREQFDRLWDGETPALGVYQFDEAVQRELLQFAPPDDREPIRGHRSVVARNDPPGEPCVPPGFEVRDYQREAVDAWFNHGGRGVWEMATGTGKTSTALVAMVELVAKAEASSAPLVIVVACPFQHLVMQWAVASRSFGFRPVSCFESSTTWSAPLSDRLAALRAANSGVVVAITTNATFNGSVFQQLLSSWSGALALVVDEVHNAGAATMAANLPHGAQYRLGLSATPDRWMDEGGTAAITRYFGDSIYSLSLLDAVSRGILSQYDYFPVTVTLDDDETEYYLDLSYKIARLVGSKDTDLGDPDWTDGVLRNLLFARARLIGGARGKIAALRRHFQPVAREPYSLVYCSDATMWGEGFEGPDTKQLDAVVSELGRGLGVKLDSYTHRDSSRERQQKLERFESGRLQALVAIRCLDEGVDIPAVRRAFILASSTNPRQFIQRRGRILRKAEGKTHASLFDFLVAPPADALQASDFSIERRLVRKELQRVVEFAEGAKNGPQAVASLSDLRERYHLLDI